MYGRIRLMRAYPANVKEIGFLGVMGETSHSLLGLLVLVLSHIGVLVISKQMLSTDSPETVERLEPVINTIGTRAVLNTLMLT